MAKAQTVKQPRGPSTQWPVMLPGNSLPRQKLTKNIPLESEDVPTPPWVA